MLDTETKQEIEALVEIKVKAILRESNHEISIRLVKIEEELRHQRELIHQVIHSMDKRFEQVDKRFEDMQHYMDKRFNQLTWMIGIGFTALTTLIALFNFF